MRIHITLFIIILFISAFRVASQTPTCPTYSKRNNGNNLGICSLDDVNNYGIYNTKTGDFIFSSTDNNFTINKVYFNNTLIQNGSQLLNGSTTFFGNIRINSNNSNMCFYGTSGSGGAAPAGYYRFEMTANGNTISCNYAIAAGNNSTLLATTPGSIGSDRTICLGATSQQLTSTSAATNYSSYKWQQSTTSSSSGFSDISPLATSSTYSPGSLSQTTYFQRIAIDANGIELASNVVTITVVNAGTISASPSTWTAPATTTFSSTGTSGGTWTSTNTSVATIDAVTGVLTTQGAGTTTITYTVLSGCTATKTITITNNNGTLPVEWESVTGQRQNGKSLINWSTASEQNTKDFEIQYSTNATDWSSIGTVLAAGNSTTQRNYSFTHTSPLKNNNYNYYRILQRDLDGKFSYSKIVSILFNEPGPDVVVYPNPVEEVLTIYTSTEQVVSLYNAAGSLVWKAKLPAGRNQLPVSKFSKGVYILATNELKTRVIIR